MQLVARITCAVTVIGMVSACAVQTPDRKSEMTGRPAYYEQAISAAKAGNVKKSIALLERVTQANPEFAVAYTDLGLQYLQANELDKAERAFEKSISLDSADFVAYNHRGVIQRKRGNFTSAKEMYLAALKHNPNYANAHLNIAVLYDIYMYDLERAMQHYKKYQLLTGNQDALVGKWIVDLERRISVKNKGAD